MLCQAELQAHYERGSVLTILSGVGWRFKVMRQRMWIAYPVGLGVIFQFPLTLTLSPGERGKSVAIMPTPVAFVIVSAMHATILPYSQTSGAVEGILVVTGLVFTTVVGFLLSIIAILLVIASLTLPTNKHTRRLMLATLIMSILAVSLGTTALIL